jgi:hypothetical protein
VFARKLALPNHLAEKFPRTQAQPPEEMLLSKIGPTVILSIMSFAEVKQEVKAMSEEQRRELSAFILQLGRERNEAWQKEMSRRMADMDAGKKVSQSDFERRVGLN